ncbi:MAG TPA: fimbria/pilus periplasmic chaperone [Sphingomonas sp.]|nr:fimbria/pilus periplasmic chaperone [Sphingomonas sp.]
MIRLKLVVAALISSACLLAGEAKAVSLEITPVAINLARGQNATTIEVRNRGGIPAAVQIRAYAWAQNGNEDVLTPTEDIIVSPPIFTLSQGVSQTIRLLLRGGIGVAGERSYRLLLDEVPPAHKGNEQIVIAMRVSLPVFVASAAPAPQALQWGADRGADNQAMLSAVNGGNSYDAVLAITATLPDGTIRKAAPVGQNPYVLPGAQRQWIVQGGRVPPGPLRLSVTTRAGKSEQNFVLAP